MSDENWKQYAREEWRELGFHYSCDEEAKTWTLTGSREGLLKFRDALLAYAAKPVNAMLSEHDHFGPSMMKVMTWSEAGFEADSIRGSLDDLRRLAHLIEASVAAAEVGTTERIREEYAPNSPFTLVLDLREDGFDPASADPGLMDVHEAIRRANAILPGVAARKGGKGTDPRWQAIIAVGEFVETHPRDVWDFAKPWASHPDEDLRMAVATCLLEHLLEFHFSALFPQIVEEARRDRNFADTLSHCWKMGDAKEPENARLLDRLLEETAS